MNLKLNKNPHLNNTLKKKGDVTMKFKPLRDRLLVMYSAEPEKSSGGIFIPDTAKEKPQKGEVVAVGQGKITDDGKLQKMEIKVGDEVLFEKYSGSKINIEDQEYLIIREDDILGIIEK
jgi:chaperonin GroES